MIQQRHRVAGHILRMIALGIMRLVRLAVATIVQRDGRISRANERLDPANIDPVNLPARGKSVNAQHGRALADNLVIQGQAVGLESGHVSHQMLRVRTVRVCSRE